MKSFTKGIMSIVLLLVMVPFLAACGSEPANDSQEPKQEEATPSETDSAATEKLTAPDKFLKIGSGPMGSGWYPITTLLGEVYMDAFDGLNASQIEGGSTSNLKSLEIGDIQYSINYTSDFVSALKGGAGFDNVLETPTGLASIYPVYQTIATLEENTDITKIEDIESKHIFLGPRGGGGPVAFWHMMAEYGITEESIQSAGGKISYGNYNDGASMLKDGIVEVYVAGGAPYVPALQEIDVTKPVKVLPLDADKLDAIIGKGHGIGKSNLPANTYKEQTEDIPTYTLVTMLAVHKDLDEEYVYNLTKVFWSEESQKKFMDQLPTRAKYFKLENAFDGFSQDQLHPGAVKYYKEVGAIK